MLPVLKTQGCRRGSTERVVQISPIKQMYGEIIRVLPQSCQEWKRYGFTDSGQYEIDPDGLEGAAPFRVECSMDKEAITIVHHDNQERTQVIGYEGPGSYTAVIKYEGADVRQLKALVDNSIRCEQFVKWECKGASLTGNTWWESRHGKKMKYWGGGNEEKGGCACNVNRTCYADTLCNCDINNDRHWLEDSGYITNRDHLPVSKLRFGDTGTHREDAYFTLGPLKCFSNVSSPFMAINAFLPLETYPAFNVHCDYDGWMTIMRHTQDSKTNFNTTWEQYRDGFGDPNADFWIGLEKIHQITTQRGKWYTLQIVMSQGVAAHLYAQYEYFVISPEMDKYRLSISQFTGTAPDELGHVNGRQFSTYDNDNDEWGGGNCATSAGGGGWFTECGGIKLTSQHMNWGGLYGLQWVEMKLRLTLTG